MKFRLKTSSHHYSAEDMEKLRGLGFVFEGPEPSGSPAKPYYLDFDGNLWVEKEIGSLEELMEFVRKFGRVIVSEGSGGWVLEIYDGYREW